MQTIGEKGAKKKNAQNTIRSKISAFRELGIMSTKKFAQKNFFLYLLSFL